MNEFLLKHGRTLVGWDEVLADTLVPGTHIMNWRSTSLAREAVQRGLKVMDITATAMCKENKLPIYVFNMDVYGNLAKVLEGEPIGTLVY